MVNILIIDGHDRRSLVAVRGLGKKKDEFFVHVGSTRRINSARYSKYCDKFVLYPDPIRNEDLFIDFIVKYIKLNQIKVLLPMGDILTEIIVNNYSHLKTITNILVPDAKTFGIARDKQKTLEVAKRIGICIPKMYNIEDIKNEKTVSYPIVIKPRIGTGSVGMKIANNKKEAIQYYEMINSQFKSPLLQEMIPDVGEHFQANLLFDKNHKLRASCVKKKIRQFPIHGGPSTFFKTVSHEEVHDLSVNLLERINWVGPAEVEYMIDPRNGEPTLMEINPRLSATIRLSSFVGVDFPYLIAKSALEEEIEVIKNTKFDYYCQWLIPGDLLNFLFNSKRFEQEYGYFFNKPENLCHMTFLREDIAPYFANLVAYSISSIKLSKIKSFLRR